MRELRRGGEAEAAFRHCVGDGVSLVTGAEVAYGIGETLARGAGGLVGADTDVAEAVAELRDKVPLTKTIGQMFADGTGCPADLPAKGLQNKDLQQKAQYKSVDLAAPA